MGPVRVTVLGSSSGSPSRVNPGSGYLIEHGESRILLDAGPGTFMRLGELVDPGTLDAVVLSHTHVDHCLDVLALYSYMAYGPSGPMPIPVHAPAGTRDHLAAFARADEDHVFHQALEFHEREPGDVAQIGPLAVTFGEAVHSVPSLVSRFDVDGASLVYSGDTGPGGDLIEVATNASMLLCEASLQGLRDTATYAYHLTAVEAGEIAATAGVFALMLTHLGADFDPQVSIDEAAAHFAGPIDYAAPGITFDIPITE